MTWKEFKEEVDRQLADLLPNTLEGIGEIKIEYIDISSPSLWRKNVFVNVSRIEGTHVMSID